MSSASTPARPGRRPARGVALTALLGLFALVAGLVAPAALRAAPAAADGEPATRSTFDRPVFLDRGHIDAFYFNIGGTWDQQYFPGGVDPYDEGVPYLALKDDGPSPYQIRRPGDVELHVKEAARTPIPAGFAVEGIAGREVYYLPLTQDHNLIWPGWETQPARNQYDVVDIQISDVEGPGEVFVWTQGSFGAPAALLADGGYQLPGTIHQSYPAHVHANWAFTEPGDYWFTVTGEMQNSETGESFTTETEMYLFSVGEGYERPLQDLTVTEPSGSYDPSQTVELTAAASPEPAGAAWSWQWMTPGGSWETIDGQDSATYQAPAGGEHSRYQLRAVLTAGETRVPTVPVRIDVEQRVPSSITVTGTQGSYEPGDPVELTAVPDPAEYADDPELEWYWERSAPDQESDFERVGEGLIYRGEVGEETHFLRAVATKDGVTVRSGWVEIVVSGAPPEVTSLQVSDPANPEHHYTVGDQISLNAQPDIPQDQVTGELRWETSADGEDWTTDPGASGWLWLDEATLDLDGTHVRAVLERGEGQDPLESNAVSLRVREDDDDEDPDPGDPDPGDPGDLPPPEVCWADARLARGHTDMFYFNIGGALGDAHFDDGFEGGSPYAEGMPYMALKDDTTSPYQVRRPEDVELHVKPEALLEFPAVDSVPEGLQGEDGYYLPLTEDKTLLWPGWESQPLQGNFDKVDIQIHETTHLSAVDDEVVEGEGEVYLWTDAGFGQAAPVLEEGYTLPGTIHQSFLAHTHAHWAFTEPGVYYLTANATLTDSESGRTFTTNYGRYAFTVGVAGDDLPEGWQDCAPAPQAPDGEDLTDENRGEVTLDPDRVPAGEQVTVTAPAVAGEDAAAFLHSDPVALTEWTPVNDEGAFVVTIPRDTAPGPHQVSVVDTDNELVGWADLEVIPARQDHGGNDGGGNGGSGGGNAGGGDGSGDGPDDDGPGGSGPGGSGPGGSGPGGSPAPTTGGGGGAAPICLPAKGGGSGGAGGGSGPGGSGGGSGPGGSSGGPGGGSGGGSGEVVYGTEGHFDFGPIIDGGELQVQVKDDRTAPPVWRDPDTVVFVLDNEHALREAATLPDDLDFISEGEDVWMIQQIQEPGVPWLGWNTQHETIVNGPGADGAELALENVEGPGEVAIFLNGTFGDLVGERVVDTVGGPTSYTIPGNTHQHGNWVFTEAGDYAMTFTVSAGGESAQGTLRFSVGQDDPSTAAQIRAGDLSPTIVFADQTADDEDEGGGESGASDEDGKSAGPGGGSQANGGGSGGGQRMGITPGGDPCVLASTGTDHDPTVPALASLLAVMLGAIAVIGSRRLHARG